MQLMQILQDLKSTASERGMSYYSNRCARKVQLNNELKEAGHEQPSSFRAKVGTAFHKLDELYYTGQLSKYTIPIHATYNREDPVQEALRVFSVYRKLFPDNEWEVVGSEVLFPSNGDERKQLESLFGVYLTGRIDTVVRISEPLRILEGERKVALEPGLYLRDIKTHGQTDGEAPLKYAMSMQFIAYMMAWNCLHPDDPCKGFLVDEVICNAKLDARDEEGKLKCFRTYFKELPTPEEQQMVLTYLKDKAAYLATGKPNPDACSDWGVCYFYKTGGCNRV